MFKLSYKQKKQYKTQYEELILLADQSTGVRLYLEKEAIYFVISGQGKIFLQHQQECAVYPLEPNLSFSILPGYAIDLCNTSNVELKLAVFSMPALETAMSSLIEYQVHNWEINQNPYFHLRFKKLGAPREKLAPDGTRVYELIVGKRGDMAIFEQNSGEISIAVKHEIVEEIWYVLSGTGQIWRKTDEDNAGAIIEMQSGVVIKLPVQTHFQFKNIGMEPLRILAISVPPWLHANESAPAVEERWSREQSVSASVTFYQPQKSTDEILGVLRSNLVI